MVSTGNMNEFCRTAIAWSTQQCSLVALRPGELDQLISGRVLIIYHSCTRWFEEDQSDNININTTSKVTSTANRLDSGTN